MTQILSLILIDLLIVKKTNARYQIFIIYKVWWHYATLFEMYYFLTFIHTIQSHSVHPSPFAVARLLESSSRLRSARGASMGCRAEIRTRSCLQQADALPTELRRILLFAAQCTIVKFMTFCLLGLVGAVAIIFLNI